MPIAIPFDDNGTAVVIPMVTADGVELADEPAAIEQYKRTGKHLGKFDTPANANSYAEKLQQDREAASGARIGTPIPLDEPAVSGGTLAPPGTPTPVPAAPVPAVPPAPQPLPEPAGFQQRWADVASRLPADRPDLLLRAQHALRTQMSAEYTDQLHLQQQTERAQKAMVRSAETEVIGDAFSDAPKLSAQAVSVDKRFDTDPEARLRMLALKQRLAERPLVDPVVSSTTMHELMRGIAAGDVDRGQVIDTFNAKPSPLSETHFAFLLKQLDDIRTPEGLKLAKDVDKLLQAAKASITDSNPLMGRIDPSGDLQFGAFEEDVRRQVEAMKREKKSLAEISDFLSVKRFRDNPSLLEPYQKTLQQSQRDMVRSLSRQPTPPPGTAAAPPAVPPAAPGAPVATAPIPPPGAATAPAVTAPVPPVPPNAPAGVLPRLPGESPGDYIKRAGGGGWPPVAPSSPVFTAPIPPPP